MTNKKARLLSLGLIAGLAAVTLSIYWTRTAVRSGPEADAKVPDGDWPMYGRTHDEAHYSPLAQIDNQTIGRLGLAWYADLPASVTAAAPPLAVNGILYVASGLSVVRAMDAVTGKLLWTYDPDVPSVAAADTLREAWGIRGLSHSDGKIFIGTQDGRLIALSAATGRPIWTAQTTTPGDGRYITGAPRVFRGLVIIGNGGADHAPVRGYVTAYDAKTGTQRWRFFTVPGEPAKGFENPAMAMAAKTWKGEWWKFGGGGNVWNAITFDPELNRIYIGTGNGMPWNQNIRSPGGGDNLFLCSVVALDADTGKYIWHYQTNPGETWDYNSAMDMTLATMLLGGKSRRVILHAPKNGFFYVIDRDTGKLVSAEPFVKVNWASRIDIATGRPVENPDARFPAGSVLLYPGALGAHSWQSMSFSARTGLVYIPSTNLPFFYDRRGIDERAWRPSRNLVLQNGLADGGGEMPTSPPDSGLIQAWDPVKQKRVWAVTQKGPLNGGVMSTAGNLVFQGQADGAFIARDAATGQERWRFFAQNGIISEPITYLAGGRQQVTIVAGFGGPTANLASFSSQFGWDYRTQQRRILTFTLGGRAALPELAKSAPEPIVRDAGFHVDPLKAAAGAVLYQGRCFYCHGLGAEAGGSAPDLRRSGVPLSSEAFAEIVRGGALAPQGMPKFPELNDGELDSIRHYIRQRANRAR